MILESGNIPVIEHAIGHDEKTKTLLLMAQIRGWVDILHESIPTGKIENNGDFNFSEPFQSREDYWKLTDSGWAAIQRRHQISILGLAVTLLEAYLTIRA